VSEGKIAFACKHCGIIAFEDWLTCPNCGEEIEGITEEELVRLLALDI